MWRVGRMKCEGEKEGRCGVGREMSREGGEG